MPLSTHKLPNKPLNGHEVLEVAVDHFRELLEADCMFMPTIAYRRVAISFQATFHFGLPHPDHTVLSRLKKADVIEGDVPLVQPDEDSQLLSLERDLVIDNPNLSRVHHGLPILVQQRAMPKAMVDVGQNLPGEPPNYLNDQLNTIENIEVRINKEDYPAPTPPVDRNVSYKKARVLGLSAKEAIVPGFSAKEDA